MVMEDGSEYKRKFLPESYFDMYYPYSHNFNTIKEEDIPEEKLNIDDNDSKKAEIEIEDYTLEYTIKEDLRKASKELNLGVDKSKLTLGTNLHLLLEIIDFNKPDYSIIKNEFYKQKIKQFINSDLMKDIKDASIYKEYQYIDEEDNSNGIIDLLIVKKDEALIIDYKTKNIADEHYDEQLKTYQRYILKKYPDKQVKMYLYSIIDGTVREVK